MFASYFIFRSVALTDEEILKILKGLLWSGGLVVIFGILQKFLPEDFLVNFGYSAVTEWNPTKYTTLPAYSFIHETHTQRLQSFFSGPNSLGAYLVLLFGLVWLNMVRAKFGKGLTIYSLYLISILVLLFLTYSRSAWIAAGFLFVVSFIYLFKYWQTRFLIIIILAAVGFLGLSMVKPNTNLLTNITRPASSNSGHYIRGAAALFLIKTHPEGLGVGTVGPNSLRFEEKYSIVDPEHYSEIAQILEKIGIQTNLATYPFVLKDSLVPENWFLQIGVEIGILGLGLFILILWGIFHSLYFIFKNIKNNFHQDLVLTVFFIGISLLIHSLFLHTWSDAPLTILYWMLVGMMFSTNKEIVNKFKSKSLNVK